MTERMTISMPDEMAERINRQLEWGDNRSELVRELIREGLNERESEKETESAAEPGVIGGQETAELDIRQIAEDAIIENYDSVPKDLSAKVEIVVEAYEFVRKRGSASKSEFVREVAQKHPNGFEIPDDEELNERERGYRGGWWRKVVRPSLEAVPDVEKPPEGGSDWQFVG